jgi:hypothetical protein
MACHRGVQLQLSSLDRFEGVDAPAWGIHLCAEYPVAGTGWQAKSAVNAGVGWVDKSHKSILPRIAQLLLRSAGELLL